MKKYLVIVAFGVLFSFSVMAKTYRDETFTIWYPSFVEMEKTDTGFIFREEEEPWMYEIRKTKVTPNSPLLVISGDKAVYSKKGKQYELYARFEDVNSKAFFRTFFMR